MFWLIARNEMYFEVIQLTLCPSPSFPSQSLSHFLAFILLVTFFLNHSFTFSISLLLFHSFSFSISFFLFHSQSLSSFFILNLFLPLFHSFCLNFFLFVLFLPFSFFFFLYVSPVYIYNSGECPNKTNSWRDEKLKWRWSSCNSFPNTLVSSSVSASGMTSNCSYETKMTEIKLVHWLLLHKI